MRQFSFMGKLMFTVCSVPAKFNGGKTFQPSFTIAFSHFMAQQELSKLF